MDLDSNEEDAEMTLHCGEVPAGEQLAHQNGAPAKADAQKMTATKLVPAKAPALASPAMPACKAPGVPASGCPGDATAQLAELQRQLGTETLLQLLQGKSIGLPEPISPPLQRAVFSPLPGSPPVTVPRAQNFLQVPKLLELCLLWLWQSQGLQRRLLSPKLVLPLQMPHAQMVKAQMPLTFRTRTLMFFLALLASKFECRQSRLFATHDFVGPMKA
jgi:hypothetical protein